jgi:ADP-ribose pyrophosphatase YjhB (NUDIX family)
MPQEKSPEIQLLANVVITNAQGQVLLTKYDADDDKWWLPGAELVAYEHPDEAAKRAVLALKLGEAQTPKLNHIESFRGRRGWHVAFNYTLQSGAASAQESAWFDAKALPDMAHGAWEKAVILKTQH